MLLGFLLGSLAWWLFLVLAARGLHGRLTAPAIDASAGFDGRLRAVFTNLFVKGPGDIDNNATSGGDLEVTYSSVVFEDGGEFAFVIFTAAAAAG